MFKWLQKKEAAPEPPSGSLIKVVEREDLFNIKIVTLPDGIIDIQFDWSDESIDIGMAIGEVLYKLCSGKFEPAIQKILDDYVADEEKLQFILAIKTYWKTLEEEDKYKEDDPVISPLQVFQMGDLPNA